MWCHCAAALVKDNGFVSKSSFYTPSPVQFVFWLSTQKYNLMSSIKNDPAFAKWKSDFCCLLIWKLFSVLPQNDASRSTGADTNNLIIGCCTLNKLYIFVMWRGAVSFLCSRHDFVTHFNKIKIQYNNHKFKTDPRTWLFLKTKQLEYYSLFFIRMVFMFVFLNREKERQKQIDRKRENKNIQNKQTRACHRRSCIPRPHKESCCRTWHYPLGEGNIPLLGLWTVRLRSSEASWRDKTYLPCSP